MYSSTLEFNADVNIDVKSPTIINQPQIGKHHDAHGGDDAHHHHQHTIGEEGEGPPAGLTGIALVIGFLIMLCIDQMQAAAEATNGSRQHHPHVHSHHHHLPLGTIHHHRDNDTPKAKITDDEEELDHHSIGEFYLFSNYQWSSLPLAQLLSHVQECLVVSI